MPQEIWGFPKIRGTFLGVPIIRIIIFWGLYWGPSILGNYHLTKIRPTTVSSWNLKHCNPQALRPEPEILRNSPKKVAAGCTRAPFWRSCDWEHDVPAQVVGELVELAQGLSFRTGKAFGT